MIHVVGTTGSDGKTIIWFFIIGYTLRSYVSRTGLNRKGAVTYFHKMIEREKKYHDAATIRQTPTM